MFRKLYSNKLLLVLVAVTMGVACKQNAKEDRKNGESSYQASYNPLPISLLTLESAVFKLSGKNLRQPIAAILFNPECDHCQRQSEELARNIDALKEITVVMISSAPLSEMKRFAVQNGLSGYENILFAYASPVDVYSTYGSIPVPYTVLYSATHKKIRDFEGEFEVGELLSPLR